ncbi:MAG: serine hydrolase [Flavobacteriales bacterium]|nr:serine hydrolase [Flavobacteriales bacterium]
MKKFLLLALLLPYFCFSQGPKNEYAIIIDKKYNNGPASSVLVTKNYETVYSSIKGSIDLENNIKADELSKFRIGSVSKQFTAIAILKLEEEGKLSVTDSIQQHLPNFPVKSHTVKIEHLLSHTSGLKEVTELDIFFSDLMKNGCDPDSLVNYFKDYPLEFEPGSDFSYCNSGYHLLGLIIEKTSGMDYNEYILKHILSPAEMANSMPDNNMTIIPNRASGYEEMNGKLVNATYLDMSIPYSAGNLLSTAQDLNNWYKALFDYKIVSQKTLEKAHQPYLLNDENSSGYGFGWFIDSLQGEKIISHEGGINGFLSSAWFNPGQKVLTVILSNCMCNPTANTAKKLMAIGMGKPLEEKKRLSLSDEILSKYVGTYDMDGEKWTISKEGDHLYFQFESGTGHPIFAYEENKFFAEEWDSKFFFVEKEGKMEFRFIYLGGVVKGFKSE